MGGLGVDDPIDVAALGIPGAGRHARWVRVDVLHATGSTNADLAAAARADPLNVDGRVIVAEHQLSGRGRLGRSWVSPPGAGLTVSVAVRPRMPAPRWSWLPLLTGLALAEAVEAAAPQVRPQLKWPNDLLVGPAKLAGVLVERVDAVAVLGCGVNVTTGTDDLPPGATSLAELGATVRRTELLAALLDALAGWLDRWEQFDGDAGPSGLRAAYEARCTTLGRRVAVELPDGTRHDGLAEHLDDAGRLVVAGAPLHAADVVHLR